MLPKLVRSCDGDRLLCIAKWVPISGVAVILGCIYQFLIDAIEMQKRVLTTEHIEAEDKL
jgi:hypothetical protein